MFNSSTSAAVNTVMGLMSHLSASDLKEILNDDSKFEHYASELKPVSNCVELHNYINLMINDYKIHFRIKILILKKKC